MDRQMLEKSGVNYGEGLHRFSENVALYEKFLNKFLTDETMPAGRDAFNRKDYPEVLTCIHTLKGVAGNLSMNVLCDKCAAVVNCIRADETDCLEALFCEIEAAYEQVMSALVA